MKRLLIFATTLLFIGCGEGTTSSAVNNEAPTESIVMKSSETYQVFPGDKIKKLSEDVQLTITHNDGEEDSMVVLLQGDAELTRQL